jgi:hypothetical protein
MLEEHFAGGRELDTAGVAVEELDPELGLAREMLRSSAMAMK